MSFDTMMASATLSTITIAVAADSPPMKAVSASSSEPAASGSASTNMSLSTAPGGNVSKPGDRDRHDEEIDQHEIERKQPGGAPDLGFAVVLDHRDVELARQQHDGDRESSVIVEQRAPHRLAREHGGDARLLQRLREQRTGPSNIKNVTKTPTARNATSLTIDSVAIASIRPS